MPLGTIQVPFPDSSMPGIRTQESGGRLVNCFIEPLGAGAPSQIVYRRAPGLGFFGTTTYGAGFRGAMLVDNLLYCAVAGSNLVSFTAVGGDFTQVGAVSGFGGTQKGFFARNNNSPADMVYVDPSGTHNSFTSGGVFTAGTLATAPNSVCCLDGFFVYTTGAGRVYASDVNSLTVNALSFQDAQSKPDGLTRGIPWAGNLFLFGPSTTEVWANVGTTPFPFQRNVVIPRGIKGPYCVAGFEDNFSRALVWVADDNTVVRLNGYQPEKISPPDLDGLIENVTSTTELEMSVYMARGHAFIVLSSLTWSWVFDLNNNKWAERQSYLLTRSRITGGIYAFGKWLCGDISSGNVHWITDERHTEINPDVTLPPHIFRWRLESGAVENFPVGGRVGRADFNFVTGVGRSSTDRTQDITGVAAGTGGLIEIEVRNTSLMHEGDAVVISGVGGTTEANGTWSAHLVSAGVIELIGSTFTNAWTSGGTLTELSAVDPIETHPTVEISWSDDGGQTYWAPIVRQLGQQSQTRELVSLIACTGRSGWHGRRWRLDIADPVHVSFMGGYQNVSPKVTDIG